VSDRWWRFVGAWLLVGFVCHAEPYFSLDTDGVAPFVRQCGQLPAMEDMKAQIPSLLLVHADKFLHDKKWKFFGLSLPVTARLRDVSLNGFRLADMTADEITIFSQLTAYRESSLWFLADQYPVNVQFNKNEIQIERKCLTLTCQDRHLENAFGLAQFNGSSPCSDIYCAVQRVFGEPKGLYILWAYLKYGENLSPWSDVNADPAGFDVQTLKDLFVAFQAIPWHLRGRALEDNGFYRFYHGKNLALYGPHRVLANSAGAVFDGIDDFDDNMKIYIFTHELGHRTSMVNGSALEDADEWRRVTGWHKDPHGDLVNLSLDGWVSEYAKKTPSEDYAETYALYRLRPAELLKRSLQRYEYMKHNVFEGIEYTSDLCRGGRNASVDH
jgi:hypothetical protein